MESVKADAAGAAAPLASKLAALKRARFTAEGKATRVTKSLAAVEATQPTRLSASEWKQFAEADIEGRF